MSNEYLVIQSVSNLSRHLKIRVFQETIESVLAVPYSMVARGGHLLYLWKSRLMVYIPACSHVSLIPVGETESPTPNCTATFQLFQTGSDLESLGLPVIAAVTANCQQTSLSCGDQHTDIYDAVALSVFSHRHSDETSEPSACMVNRPDWVARRLARPRLPE